MNERIVFLTNGARGTEYIHVQNKGNLYHRRNFLKIYICKRFVYRMYNQLLQLGNKMIKLTNE